MSAGTGGPAIGAIGVSESGRTGAVGAGIRAAGDSVRMTGGNGAGVDSGRGVAPCCGSWMRGRGGSDWAVSGVTPATRLQTIDAAAAGMMRERIGVTYR